MIFSCFFLKRRKYAYKEIVVLTQVPNSKEPHTTTAVARKTIHSDPCSSLPLYGASPAAAPAPDPDAAMPPRAPLTPGGAAAGSQRRATGSNSCATRPSCREAAGRCQRLRWRKETEGAALQWSSSGDAPAAGEGSVAAIPGGTERAPDVATCYFPFLKNPRSEHGPPNQLHLIQKNNDNVSSRYELYFFLTHNNLQT
jgi:hypothetical protein